MMKTKCLETKRLGAWLPLALGVALFAVPAAAQSTSVLRSQTETSVNAVQGQMRQAMQPGREDGVTYVSGGVGKEAVQAMHEIAPNYNLRLMFAVAGSGEYLANVHVKVMGPKGRTVLDTVSEGPYFFAKVPPGRYQVVADAQGTPISRSIDVGQDGSVAQSFYWHAAG